jgi:hypothetical protein
VRLFYWAVALLVWRTTRYSEYGLLASSRAHSSVISLPNLGSS